MAVTAIRHARIDLGFSQFDVARRCGMSQGKFSYIERGLVPTTERERQAIAAVLGQSVERLFP
jgi:transcriptional regulator with XRE-family HTH domain